MAIRSIASHGRRASRPRARLYPIVTNSQWLVGGTDYNDLNKGLPYWFNGLVPLAYLTEDQRHKNERARAADMVLSLQWLYERDLRAQGQTFLDCMRMLHENALDWEHWYTDGVYLKHDQNTIPSDITDANDPFEHGVNVAMDLKSGAVFRRLMHDKGLATRALRAVNCTARYHGTVSGSIIGDERISGLSPARGVELCTVVETTFSLSYLCHALGDNSLADQCELAAFNALRFLRLVYTVDAVAPSNLSVRIPGWSALPTISVNGAPLRGAAPDTQTGMLKTPLDQGSSEVIVTLAAELHMQRRANDTVAIYYGNLLYTIPVQYTQTSRPYPNHPGNIRDYEIDPSSLQYNGLTGLCPVLSGL
ncbi:uncharacterized protein NFIA_032890 [Aspergillus fischeri NRRL 181]|uniref:Uncharacterized protein n=1 Tax=Neosartorya fischeri (strain ATCC 1020 / DSM 3700 / CBS 544.65 / FGSC A1164 / JCM 1740 / NRRL 181 / WB 181) TaxID=331117 RepID=A1CYA4_NEOFI|nr:uncharacterized protein NFIA_032890 [Aspergillus fischeri NRRL 181]EAW23724.1 hypothetical protein NFIA_032890 [Aspergillus fischeri NRRL 181]